MRLSFKYLVALRVPLSAAMFLATMLTYPGQVKEVLRGLARSPTENLCPVFSIVLLLIAVSACLSWLARHVVRTLEPQASLLRLKVWAHSFFLVPFASIVGGCIGSRVPVELDGAGQINACLSGAAVALVLTGAISTVCLAVTRDLTDQAQTGGLQGVGWGASIGSLIFLAVVVALSARVGIHLAQQIGTIALILLFVLCLLPVLQFSADKYRTTGISPALVVLVLAIGFSWTGWNDNHVFRSSKPSGIHHGTITENFAAWLKARGDLNAYRAKGEPYPVYIVAAEGGGAYAAFHVATVLSRLQDTCPSFSQHTFAVSGVSGGSLGAAVFAGLSHENARNDRGLRGCTTQAGEAGRYRQATDLFFNADLLAPLVAGALFPDLFQRFLPVAFPSFDRAYVLERGMEEAWQPIMSSGAATNPFAGSLRALWSPQGATPALLLNTTEVHIGRQEIVAPFEVDFVTSPQSGLSIGDAVDVRLSTAVVLSARFPWLTPAGRYGWDNEAYQFVDGGYLDNSGTETAERIIEAIVKGLDMRNGSCLKGGAALSADDEQVCFQIHLLSVRAENLPGKPTAFGEIETPVRTMLSTHQERGLLAWRRSLTTLCSACDAYQVHATDTVQSHLLNMRGYPFPLGWYLSPDSRTAIANRTGSATDCQMAAVPTVLRFDIKAVNDCTYWNVQRTLNGSGM